MTGFKSISSISPCLATRSETCTRSRRSADTSAGLPPRTPWSSFRSPGFVDHFRRVLLGERNDPERDVAEDLDQGTPHAEHDGMAELEIAGHPDDDLVPRCGHGAHEDSALARPESLDDAGEVPKRLPDSRFVLHVQDDSPDVALVRHVQGVHLHRDGIADLPGGGHGFLLVARLPRRDDADSLACQERDRVGRGEGLSGRGGEAAAGRRLRASGESARGRSGHGRTRP